MRIFVLLMIWLIAIVLLSYTCFITKFNDVNKTNKKKSIETIIEQDINNTDNSTINIIKPVKEIEENLTQEIKEEEANITEIPTSIPEDIPILETNESNKIIIKEVEEYNSSLEELEENIITKEIKVDKILLCQNMFNSILSKEKIYFDKNRFNIKDSSKSTLDKLIELSKECPNGKIVIAGYTDSRGSAKTNRRISLKRANAVKDYFIKGGVSSERLVSVGYGEIKPIATNSTAKGREQNRRIEIHIEGVNDE